MAGGRVGAAGDPGGGVGGGVGVGEGVAEVQPDGAVVAVVD